jgi:hypothetical protein
VPRHTGFVTTDEVLNTTPKTDSQPIVGRCKFRRPRLKRLFVVILDQSRTDNPQFAGPSRSFRDKLLVGQVIECANLASLATIDEAEYLGLSPWWLPPQPTPDHASVRAVSLPPAQREARRGYILSAQQLSPQTAAIFRLNDLKRSALL